MTAPSAVRSAWRDLCRAGGPATLRISLLASYTIDPLVPYLGVALHEAGLPATLHVGPFGQIAGQCLDDTGDTAAHEPDVLIVSPRFEELGRCGPEWTDDLAGMADAAAATVGRWSGALLFVLPALPPRVSGTADGLRGGTVAQATLAREAVRDRLAGLPNVLLADIEDVLREVGSLRAYHPTMFKLAKVPYTEDLLARFGRELGRLVGTRYGVTRRAAVFDIDDLPVSELSAPVRALREAGVPIGFTATGAPADVWSRLATGCPELVECVDVSIIDDRPSGDRLRSAGAALGRPVVPVTPLLGERPEAWLHDLGAAGLFDRPAPLPTVQSAPEPPARPVTPRSVSLDDFVAGLNVVVEFPDAAGHLAKVAEVVERAKDFTMGNPHSAERLAERGAEVVAVSVRDRLGDYGISGAFGMRRAGGECEVDLFSLSCPVLGKRVEDAVLREITRRADGARVVFRHRETEHNRVATEFLSALPQTGGEPAPAGPAVRFGIVAFGHSLPEPSEVDDEAAAYTGELDRIRGWGYHRFHRAPDGVGLTDLAVEAGERALAEAGVAAADVDVVVLAIADLAEYLYWDPAAATQARLGAHNAEALLVNQACGGGVAAFDLVAGKFAVHRDYDTALVIGANRVADPYWNRMEINSSVYSDGAAAAVLRRDHGTCQWLATKVLSDGAYADFMRMDVGAAARPFLAGTAEQPHVRNPQDRMDAFFGGDVRKMYRFVSMIRERNREVVDAACAAAGVARGDLAKVIHFNDNVRQLADLAKDLGIPLELTNVDMAVEHGHLGCADQLLTLRRMVGDGDVAAGDLVALTSTSSGMHWMCTLLRV